MKYVGILNWFATVWSVYSIIFLKTMKTATTVCATRCLIANVVDLVELYGRLWSLQNSSQGHWEVKIISIAAEGT